MLSKGFHVYGMPLRLRKHKHPQEHSRSRIYSFSASLLLVASYLKLGAGTSEAAAVMELVSCPPLMTSWEGVRASLHDHRLHQNHSSWGMRPGCASTVEHEHLKE